MRSLCSGPRIPYTAHTFTTQFLLDWNQNHLKLRQSRFCCFPPRFLLDLGSLMEVLWLFKLKREKKDIVLQKYEFPSSQPARCRGSRWGWTPAGWRTVSWPPCAPDQSELSILSIHQSQLTWRFSCVAFFSLFFLGRVEEGVGASVAACAETLFTYLQYPVINI